MFILLVLGRYRVVWYMEARNTEEITSGYTDLARALDFTIDSAMTLSDTIAKVHARLQDEYGNPKEEQRQIDEPRCLLIYDDAKSEANFFEAMTPGLPTGCDVLITSRSPNWTRVEVCFY